LSELFRRENYLKKLKTLYHCSEEVASIFFKISLCHSFALQMKEDGGKDGCGGRRDFCLPITFKNCDTSVWTGYNLFQFNTLKNCCFSIPVKLKVNIIYLL
jgi:hypothetical protein